MINLALVRLCCLWYVIRLFLKREYRDVRLDVVSSKDFTILSDDLMSSSKLGQKFQMHL